MGEEPAGGARPGAQDSAMRTARSVPLVDVLRRGFDALQAKDYKTVANVLEAVWRQHPHEPNALLIAASMALEKGKCFWPTGEPRIDGFVLAEEWAKRAVESVTLPWPAAWGFKSALFFRLGRLEESLGAADKALEIDPNFYHALVNRGNVLMGMGRYQEAEDSYVRAGNVRPGDAPHRFNGSFLRLIAGDWQKGFDMYEARWLMKEWQRDHGRPIHTSHPRWWGEPLNGKRLFLHWEQGYGDSIMMLRYLPWIRSKGPGHIVLEVQKALMTLCEERLDTSDLTIIGPTMDFEPCDLWCPLFGLPALHQTTQDTVPDGRWLRRAA